MRFFKMFKVFLKSGPRGEKSGKMGEKRLSQNPHYPTTTALGRILFSSVVMVLAFPSGVPGSNPVRTLYFYHAFIHFCLCYELCS